MSKKFVAKLIATVMAMTMVVGMGTTALAAEDSHGIDHDLSAVSDLADHTPIYDNSAIDATHHANLCSICGAHSSLVTCSYRYMPVDASGHIEMCPIAVNGYHWKYNATLSDVEAHDTNGANGTCSVCNFDPNNFGGGSCGSDPAPSTPAAPTAEQLAEEAVKVVEATIAKEEALPVTSFASTAAVNAIPAEAKAGNDATFNISAVTTTQGFVAAVNKIAKASVAAPAVSVYSSKPIAMNATALSAVAKTGKAFVYTFSYKGHIYKVTIPAGAKVVTNGQAFVGPLAIGAQLGTTQIVK